MKIDDSELTQVLLALHDASQSTQDAMQRSAVEAVSGTWGPALASAAGTNVERRLLADGSFATIGPASIDLHAGAGGPLSGGLNEHMWPAVEYGMDPVQIIAPNRTKTIRVAGSGREMRLASRVWVGKNLKRRNDEGYVIFPTVRKHGPRFVAAWIYGLIRVWEGTPFEVRKG